MGLFGKKRERSDKVSHPLDALARAMGAEPEKERRGACPKCGHIISVAGPNAGSIAKLPCPKCGTSVTIR